MQKRGEGRKEGWREQRRGRWREGKREIGRERGYVEKDRDRELGRKV